MFSTSVYLGSFTCFGGEHAEAVVPKSAGYQKSTIHGGDEAVAANLKFLAEIVAQMST